MGLKKGQAPESFKQGKVQAKDFRTRTKEEMKEITAKAVQNRVKKNRARKEMREQLKELMKMDLTDKSAIKTLKEDFGLEDEDICNQMLLMVALFKKGLEGDVQAIKQIDDMVNGTDTKNENQPIVINIQTANPAKEKNTKVVGNKSTVHINSEDDEEWPEEEE